MADVKETWIQIEAWLRSHAKQVAEALPGPAAETAIAKTEDTIGIRFPDDLRASYLTQNGAEYGEGELCILPCDKGMIEQSFCLLPIEEVAAEWRSSLASLR